MTDIDPRHSSLEGQVNAIISERAGYLRPQYAIDEAEKELLQLRALCRIADSLHLIERKLNR